MEESDIQSRRALGLHQLHGQAEEAAGLVADHLEIFLLGGTRQRVPPEQIHALTAMEIQQLLDEDVDGNGVL
jgi:hypothetical protein